MVFGFFAFVCNDVKVSTMFDTKIGLNRNALSYYHLKTTLRQVMSQSVIDSSIIVYLSMKYRTK